MPRALRTAAFVLLLLAVSALAFAPLFGSSFTAEDVPYLVRASPAAGPGAAALASRLADADGPLARASLRVSCALWTSGGRWSGIAVGIVRIENVLLLLGAAALARLALRRTLAPWMGSDGARAAAGACALLLACHPSCVPAVARVGARGELLALCLGAAAAALFLHGRQEKRFLATGAAAVATILAGHAAPIGLLVAPLLAVLELFSSRRGRPIAVRLRTSATTLVVFAACASLETLAGPALGSAALLPRTLARIAEMFRAVPAGTIDHGTIAYGTIASGTTALAESGWHALARGLGALALPVPPIRAGIGSASAIPSLLAGALLLAAFQPALVAARSAPRSWGWLGAAASVGIALAMLVGLATASGSSAGERAVDLLPAAVVACCVLATASTALSGPRRVLVPAALAASFAILAQIATGPWVAAGDAAAPGRSGPRGSAGPPRR